MEECVDVKGDALSVVMADLALRVAVTRWLTAFISSFAPLLSAHLLFLAIILSHLCASALTTGMTTESANVMAEPGGRHRERCPVILTYWNRHGESATREECWGKSYVH